MSDFTIAHLQCLAKNGLPLPPQLGVIPFRQPTSEHVFDVKQWGLLNTYNQPSDDAREYFTPVTDFHECYFGVIMLHNQKRDMNIIIPADLAPFKMHMAMDNTPRLNYSVFVNNLDIMTCALSNADNFVEFTTSKRESLTNITPIVDFIFSLLDPESIHQPANVGTFTVPYTDVQTLVFTPNEGADTEEEIAEYVDAIDQQHPDLKEMLLWDNIASLELNYTTTKELDYTVFSSPSLGVTVFYEEGMVVSYPVRDYSGETSIKYTPCTVENLERGLQSLKNYYQGAVE